MEVQRGAEWRCRVEVQSGGAERRCREEVQREGVGSRCREVGECSNAVLG